jgi:hypothetical protein
MAVLVLVLVVLTFGISIASRYNSPHPTADQIAPPLPDADSPGGGAELRIAGPPREMAAPPADRVTVEIANGCGISGLASDLRFELQGPSFDVVDTGNADHYDYVETVVVAAEVDRPAAESVVRFLRQRFGVGQVRIQTHRPSSLAQVRLVIGTDLANAVRRAAQ